MTTHSPATPAATPAVDDGEPKTQKEQLEKIATELKTQREELRKDREASALKAKTVGIRSAIAMAGINDPDATEILFDHIDRRHGSKIQTDGEKVTVTDELGDSKDIGEFIAELLKSPKGKFFKPRKTPGPNTRAGRGNSAVIPGQKTVMEMSATELAALTPEQVSALFKQAK